MRTSTGPQAHDLSAGAFWLYFLFIYLLGPHVQSFSRGAAHTCEPLLGLGPMSARRFLRSKLLGTFSPTTHMLSHALYPHARVKCWVASLPVVVDHVLVGGFCSISCLYIYLVITRSHRSSIPVLFSFHVYTSAEPRANVKALFPIYLITWSTCAKCAAAREAFVTNCRPNLF